MKTRSILLFACLPVLGFVHHPTADFRLTQAQGHAVYVSPEALADADLASIHAILPEAAVRELAGIPFWIEHDNPETPGMTYHPSREWLSGHGYNPDKARGIEIGNLRNFLAWHREQPFMVLHEMSHAYHDQVLGFDHATVKWAYDLAVAGAGRTRSPTRKSTSRSCRKHIGARMIFTLLCGANCGTSIRCGSAVGRVTRR